jgi:membrane associated rhomboid family serine protease
MGIYDRDYNRPESYEQQYTTGGTLSGLTPVVKWLLIVNFVIFVANALVFPSIDPESGHLTLLDLYGSVFPATPVFALQLWRLVTYQFLHGGVGHLVFNMLVLYFMGPFVERAWGGRAFIKFYLICGAAGGFLYTSLVMMKVMQPGVMVGASGAIYGVMAAVAYMFPRLRVLLWGIIPMTMIRLIILVVIISLLTIAFGQNVGGELAHMTGLGVGFLSVMYKPWLTNLRMKREKGSWTRKIEQEREFLKEVDIILDKVHRDGIQSLSAREKHILQEATRREQQHAHKQV